MNNVKNKKYSLVFWRDVPMDVNLGAFLYLTKNWDAEIVVISLNDFPDERKKCGYEIQNLKNVRYICLSDVENRQLAISELFKEFFDAIHLFYGVRGDLSRILDYYLKINKDPRVAIIAERPNENSFQGFSGKIKEIGRYFLYRSINFKYRKKVKCFFAMGISGVNKYASFGWNKKILYDYMYCPLLPEIIIENNKENDNGVIKFLYIGRFDKKNKGIDVLMKSIDLLSDFNNFKIDFVGGYGDDKNEVLKWIESNPKASFSGKWDNNKVCFNMLDYDVCVVPSKYDGWNLTPNQAINSGIGTIITDMAGSQELIEHSKSGNVVCANSVENLTRVIKNVLLNSEIINEWKANAIKYKPRISAETVGKYFIDVINYEFLNIGDKPVCPW